MNRAAAVDWWMTPEDVAALCPPCADKMRASNIKAVRASAVFGQDAFRIMQARTAAWEKLPKGWTEDSLKSFWSNIAGSGKHKVTACMEKMKGKIDDPGAFCASLADHFFGTGWRGKEGSMNKDARRVRDDFAEAMMVRSIVARFRCGVTEHPTEDARNEHLKLHPEADPKNHVVKKDGPDEKDEPDEKGKDKPDEKGKGEKPPSKSKALQHVFQNNIVGVSDLVKSGVSKAEAEDTLKALKEKGWVKYIGHGDYNVTPKMRLEHGTDLVRDAFTNEKTFNTKDIASKLDIPMAQAKTLYEHLLEKGHLESMGDGSGYRLRKAMMVRSIVARYFRCGVTEHPTEDARNEYLKLHPGADPKNHVVKKDEDAKKPEKEEKGKEEGKAEGKGKDLSEKDRKRILDADESHHSNALNLVEKVFGNGSVKGPSQVQQNGANSAKFFSPKDKKEELAHLTETVKDPREAVQWQTAYVRAGLVDMARQMGGHAIKLLKQDIG